MRPTVSFDFIIVGQGIAGTALAWTLLERGASVLVVDRGDAITASRISAGLITPVAGKRFTVAADFASLKACAQAHYQTVARRTGHHCFLAQPAVRLCRSQDEVEALELRRARLGNHITGIDPPLAAGFGQHLHGLQMPGAARLDVAAYLDHSRQAFCARDSFRKIDVDPESVAVVAGEITLHGGALSGRHIVFCGGYADASNRWLPNNAFDAAKGEILTVRIAGLSETRTVHAADSWLVPATTANVYRYGATYDHDDLQAGTTTAARETLTDRLASFVNLPFEVLAQDAAIRPVGARRQPVIGRHPLHPNIAWLNGLSSKGALWAPALAQRLASHLLDGKPLA